MSGDHLNKLALSPTLASLSNQNTCGQSNNSNSNQSSAHASYVSNCHNPVKLVHAFSPLNHRYVKLSVGGRLFTTSIDTLTRQDNMLRAMFSGRIDVTTDTDGYILIDRCGKHFEFILNYLRDEDTQCLAHYLDYLCNNESDLYELLKETRFYCIEPLVSAIELKLAASRQATETYFGNSIVSMVSSKSELTKILASSEKPFIRLLINRHNNKYSYTSNSDDNLLRNIELFERMSIKFKNRIMFIKDTTSTEEICCWYFDGGGRNISEVCCTSIVYTTEKKQTKVEFPDSKILEEIFVNAVLFESKDNDLVDDENVSDENARASNCVASLAASASGLVSNLASSNGALNNSTSNLSYVPNSSANLSTRRSVR